MFVGEGANLLSINHDSTDQPRFLPQCDDEGGARATELVPGAPIGNAVSVARSIENIDEMDGIMAPSRRWSVLLPGPPIRGLLLRKSVSAAARRSLR